MRFIVIAVDVVAVLLLSRFLERKWLPGDAEAREQFRRRFHAWCFTAAVVAFFLMVVLAVYLRGAAEHG